MREDGEQRWVTAQGERIRTQDGQFVVRGYVQDITPQKERLNRLKQVETLFENAQDMLFIVGYSDGEFVVERVNEAFEATTGLSNEYLSGKTPREIFGEERGTQIERNYAQCIETGAPLKYEETVSEEKLPDKEALTDDGLTYWETRIAPVAADDQVEYIVGATRDISERKQYERRLEYAELVFEHAQESILLLEVTDDEEFIIERVNPALAKKANESPADLVGKTMPDVVGETQGRAMEARYRTCLDRQEPITYEEAVEHRGTTRHWKTKLVPIVEDGVVTHILGTATDITALKERERELQARSTAMEASIDGMAILDDNETYTFVNQAHADIYGYDEPDALLDESWGMCYGEDMLDRIDAEILPELHETGSWRGEATGQRRDGTAFPQELSLTALDGGGVICVVRDISERKRREQELKDKNEQLNQFTSIVSHDLRNPLNVATGSLKLARQECESEHLDRIGDALNRMDTLVGDLLALSRGGETITELEPVEPAAMAEDCWTTVETTDATRVIDVDQTVYADGSRLRQVFENLFRNAVEHGGDDVTVAVGELEDGFYVEDDGGGIPEDERDDVFNAGYSTNHGGTGFGLSIVEQVVEAHGWSISATESESGGARFEITDTEVVEEE